MARAQKVRAICRKCGRRVLLVNGKFRSHGFSFLRRKRCPESGQPFLYDFVVPPPSPEACARFARQIEAMIGRPITQADVDSLRNMGRPAKGSE